MDILGRIEAYLPEGKVEYDIEDGEVYTEEDFESLMEQGAFDNDDNDESMFFNAMKDMFGSKPTYQYSSTTSKSRKVRRKIAKQNRKINRSK